MSFQERALVHGLNWYEHLPSPKLYQPRDEITIDNTTFLYKTLLVAISAFSIEPSFIEVRVWDCLKSLQRLFKLLSSVYISWLLRYDKEYL